MNKNNRRVSGLNVYLDQYDNYVYYNVFNKRTYVIEEKDEQKFNVLKDRYIFVFIVFVLLSGIIELPMTYSIIAMIAALVLVELYFRLKFLPSLKSYADVKLKRRVWYNEDNRDQGKLILIAILYVVFAGLLVANAIEQQYGIALLIVTGIIVAFAIFRLVFTIVGLVKSKKGDK